MNAIDRPTALPLHTRTYADKTLMKTESLGYNKARLRAESVINNNGNNLSIMLQLIYETRCLNTSLMKREERVLGIPCSNNSVNSRGETVLHGHPFLVIGDRRTRRIPKSRGQYLSDGSARNTNERLTKLGLSQEPNPAGRWAKLKLKRGNSIDTQELTTAKRYCMEKYGSKGEKCPSRERR